MAMKEIKRIKHRGYELRLIYQPPVKKITNKDYRYKWCWIIQVRPPGAVRFLGRDECYSKKDGLFYLLKKPDQILEAFLGTQRVLENAKKLRSKGGKMKWSIMGFKDPAKEKADQILFEYNLSVEKLLRDVEEGIKKGAILFWIRGFEKEMTEEDLRQLKKERR